MRIALDYDDTYTQDPRLWNNFVQDAFDKGHEIMVVTFRSPDLPIDHDIGIPVYYTSWKAKRQYMELQGIDIDVWIDDSPELILSDKDWSTQEIEQWMDSH